MSAADKIGEALRGPMAAAGLPGFAAAARLPGGEAIEIAMGVRGTDNPAPMTVDSHFWIASCTKALTSTAAMQLVEAGKIGLDDPVGRWAPRLASPKRLAGLDADGRTQLASVATPITLRHLLTHTSGLAYGFTSAELNRHQAAVGATLNDPEGPDTPLLFEPGKGWVYGIGIDWAGRLIEVLSGEPFGDYMRAHVFAPLSMNETTFFPSEAQKARAVSMHARTPDGGVTPIPFGMSPEPSFMMGGGGLYSTVGDYLKFMDSILGRGPQILARSSVDLLCAAQVEGPEVGILRSAQPNTSNDFDPLPGIRRAHTLGFVTNLDPGPNGRGTGSLAWAGLGNCYYWIDRAAGAAGIFCTQLLPFADARALDVFATFERAVYAA
jgi:CubicO group peptidase (beta-lactamase class C family)